MALTDQKRLFAEEYLKRYCREQAESAIEAGYSPKHAASIASRLLKEKEVREYIDSRLSEKCMAANEVLVRLAEQARGEASRYLRTRADGEPWIDIESAIEDGKAHLIKGISRDKHGNVVVETYDAHAALVDLGRVHKLFTDKSEVTHDLSRLTDAELDAIIEAGERGEGAAVPDGAATVL